ncbi:MAG: chorismate mutase [bacterium]|nr:chorismate mutase [bacterium]
MEELKKLREKIDLIDAKLLDLLEKRARVAKEIYLIKQRDNIPIFDVLREDEKLAWVGNYVKLFPKEAATKIFVEIFSATRKIGGNVKVAYLGPEGSFSHLASISVFGSSAEFSSGGLEDIFLKVQKGETDFGVIPMENSRDGLVGESLDLLLESNVKIIYEVSMKVSFCFFSNAEDIKDVKRLYSHQKALVQCSKWIKDNLVDVDIIYTSSTSEGARRAYQDKQGGAIASEEISKILDFKIFIRDIQDSPDERTEFAVISSNDLYEKLISTRDSAGKKIRVSFCFSVVDEPGSLFRVLQPIAKRKINMKKIHSRPDKITKRYNFFVEIERPNNRSIMERTFTDMKKNTVFFKIFGEYPYRVI